jgi:TolB-like protein/Tfp pilus assembly protein PilF
MSLLTELKRRNVFRMAGLYLVASWLLVQVGSTLFPAFGVPPWALRALVIVLALGFVPALVFAWAFELTPDGLKRDEEVDPAKSIAPQTAQRMNRLIIAGLAMALAYFGFDKFVLAPRRDSALVAATTQAVQAAAPTMNRKSIAVLPFENLSENKANGYFADGIQDQILTGLAKIGDLKVISRTSTQKYSSRPENLSTIGRELGVAMILEGSVQRDGNTVLINVQLIEAATDSHIWAETYTRTLDNVFAVESEVAKMIAESLSANISRGEREALEQKPTKVPAAFDAYLKARALNSVVLQTREQGDATLAAYREAVRLDPDFALAWAQLARECFRIGWIGVDPKGELRVEGEQALARAQALAPGAPQTEVARAVHMYYIDRDFAGALAVLDGLKSKLPNDPDVRMWAGYLSRRLGRFEESVANFEKARELSPNDANIIYHLGVSYITTGNCARALQSFDASLALGADNTHALGMKLQCAWMQGDLPAAATWLAAADAKSPAVQGLQGIQLLYEHKYAAAAERLQRAIAGGGDTSIDSSMNGYLPARVEWQLLLALAQQRLGQSAQARASNEHAKAEALAALADKPDSRYVETGWHLTLGIAQAGLGERDAAAEQGRIAVALVPESADHLEGPGWLVYQARIFALNGDAAHAVPLLRHLEQIPISLLSAQVLRMDPVWDPIRKDPGFQALMK